MVQQLCKLRPAINPMLTEQGMSGSPCSPSLNLKPEESCTVRCQEGYTSNVRKACACMAPAFCIAGRLAVQICSWMQVGSTNTYTCKDRHFVRATLACTRSTSLACTLPSFDAGWVGTQVRGCKPGTPLAMGTRFLDSYDS